MARIVGQNLLPPSYLTVPAETCPANLINDVSVIFSLVVIFKGEEKEIGKRNLDIAFFVKAIS